MGINTDLQIAIDTQTLDIGPRDELGLAISYSLENPENFEQKQGALAYGIDVPATPNNSRIFNSFEQPNVEDLTGDDYYKNPRPCSIIVSGVEILRGKSILESGSHSRMPGKYTFNCYGNNGDWVIDMKDLTLWDCLNTTPHDFTVANVEDSWGTGPNGFNADEFHDYVYAPVRYRQPFGPNDDAVTIYHLRPALSIYWMLVRGFRTFGYTLSSRFLSSNFFQRLVMPWVWGDFYDINGQLTDGLAFKAGGAFPIDAVAGTNYPPAGAETTDGFILYGVYTAIDPTLIVGTSPGIATPPNPDTSLFHIQSSQTSVGSGDHYIFTQTNKAIPWLPGFSSLQTQVNFRINYTEAPLGYDNFGLYSFDETTGTMQWRFAPPAALAPFIGNNITANFVLNLYAFLFANPGSHCDLYLEIKHFDAGNTLLGTTTTHIINAAGGGQSGDNGCFGGGGIGGTLNIPITNPWVYNFSVSGINNGDYLQMRLKWNASGTAQSVTIASSFYMDMNPSQTGANPWQYNPATQQWANIDGFTTSPVWQYFQSSLALTGLQIVVGGAVHFQWYDKFRSFKLLDLFRGLVDMFNWSVQTNPISKVVTVEPTHAYTLPDGTRMPGYFISDRLDWTSKLDLSKENIMNLFTSSERELNFSFKGDGSDGGQNIYAARYKAIYLNNKLINPINNTNTENGIISAIPGASRYMLPPRFQKGAKQYVNRFFATTMHYFHTKWKGLGGTVWPAPQLIAIMPENVSDSSANSITQTFEPKIAYYKGLMDPAGFGGWRWQGDPVGRGYDLNGIGIPTYNDAGSVVDQQPISSPQAIDFGLPFMFSVNYNQKAGLLIPGGDKDPVLSYCDQLVYDNTATPATPVVAAGLMKRFFLTRLATMRNGKQYKPFMVLGITDVINWEHRNAIIINGALYNLININGYKPLTDDSTQCVFWKVTNPDQVDIDNSFPSPTSIAISPTILAQYDLKYAQLLLFMTDLPQIG